MDEEKFAAEIDPIFLDDLQVECERLEGLSKMRDMDIFTVPSISDNRLSQRWEFTARNDSFIAARVSATWS